MAVEEEDGARYTERIVVHGALGVGKGGFKRGEGRQRYVVNMPVIFWIMEDLEGDMRSWPMTNTWQSVLLEELTRARDVDLFKEVGSLGEGIPKRMGRIPSEFRRLAVDDDKHHVFDIWKATGELEIVLSSGKMFRDEGYVVRVDAQVHRRIAEARHGH